LTGLTPLSADTFYTVKVKVKTEASTTTRFMCYVNDILFINTTDSDLTYGGFAILTYDWNDTYSISFDDILIEVATGAYNESESVLLGLATLKKMALAKKFYTSGIGLSMSFRRAVVKRVPGGLLGLVGVKSRGSTQERSVRLGEDIDFIRRVHYTRETSYCLQFNDDSQGRVDCGAGSSFNFNTAGTLEIWIKCTYEGAGYTWPHYVGKQLFRIYQNGDYGDGSISLYVVANTNEHWVPFLMKSTWNDGKWHHLVGTFDNSLGSLNIKTYADGQYVSGANETNTLDWNYAEVLTIGSASDASYTMTGFLYKARVYNRALSATEVEEHFRGIYTNNTGLAGRWDLDEGAGTTCADLSGNGNTGTLYGGVSWVSKGKPTTLVGETSTFTRSRIIIGRIIKPLVGLKPVLSRTIVLSTEILPALMGLISARSKLVEKFYRSPSIGLSPHRTYGVFRGLVVKAGLLSKRTKQVSKKSRDVFLGLKVTRVKTAGKLRSALLGLKASNSRRITKLRSALLGLKVVRTKLLSKGMLAASVGLVSKRIKAISKAPLKPLLGLISRRLKSVSKVPLKPLLGLLSKRVKGFAHRTSTMIGLLSRRLLNVNKVRAALLGLVAKRARGMSDSQSTFVGLRSSTPLKNITKILKTTVGLLSDLAFLFEQGSEDYIESMSAALGLLSVSFKRISMLRTMSTQLGERVTASRLGQVVTYLSARLGEAVSRSRRFSLARINLVSEGLISRRVKLVSKIKSVMLGLISVRRKGLSRIEIVAVGLISRRLKSIMHLIKAMLGLVSSRYRLLSLHRSLTSILGLLSARRKAVSRISRSAVGLVSIRTDILNIRRALNSLLGLLPKRVKSVAKVKGVMLGLRSNLLKKISKIRSSAVGLRSGISRRIVILRLKLASLGLRVLVWKQLSIVMRLLVGLISSRVRRIAVMRANVVGIDLLSVNVKSISRSLRALIGLLASRRKQVMKWTYTKIGLLTIRRKSISKFAATLLGLVSSRGKAISKLARSFIGLISIRSRISQFRRAVQVRLGLVARISRIAGKSIRATIGVVALMNRRISLKRIIEAYDGLVSVVLTTGMVIETFMASIGLAVSRARRYTSVRYIVSPIGITAYRIKALIKRITTLLGLLAVRSRGRVKLFNVRLGEATQLLRRLALRRSNLVLVGLVSQLSSILKWIRQFTTLVGLSTLRTRLSRVFRLLATRSGVGVVLSRLFSIRRAFIIREGLLTTSLRRVGKVIVASIGQIGGITRRIAIGRAIISNIGTSAWLSTSALGNYLMSFITVIGEVASYTRRVDLLRVIQTTLGFVVSRVMGLSRIVSSVLGLKSMAFRLIETIRIIDSLIGELALADAHKILLNAYNFIVSLGLLGLRTRRVYLRRGNISLLGEKSVIRRGFRLIFRAVEGLRATNRRVLVFIRMVTSHLRLYTRVYYSIGQIGYRAIKFVRSKYTLAFDRFYKSIKDRTLR
jgi:hypothetical protein